MCGYLFKVFDYASWLKKNQSWYWNRKRVYQRKKVVSGLFIGISLALPAILFARTQSRTDHRLPQLLLLMFPISFTPLTRYPSKHLYPPLNGPPLSTILLQHVLFASQLPPPRASFLLIVILKHTSQCQTHFFNRPFAMQTSNYNPYVKITPTRKPEINH